MPPTYTSFRENMATLLDSIQSEMTSDDLAAELKVKFSALCPADDDLDLDLDLHTWDKYKDLFDFVIQVHFQMSNRIQSMMATLTNNLKDLQTLMYRCLVALNKDKNLKTQLGTDHNGQF